MRISDWSSDVCSSDLNEKRWNKFCEYAVNWDKRQILLRFLAEIEARLVNEADIEIGDRKLSEWVEWGKATAEALNPFSAGAARSEERREGHECVSTSRSRRTPYR